MRLLLIVVVLVGGAIIWSAWPRSYNLTVNISPSLPGYAARVYTVPEGNNSGGGTPEGDPVAEFTQSQTISLREGSYVVVGGSEPDFSIQTTAVDLISDQSISVQPVYSEAKLASLLASETPAIQQAIRTSVFGLDSTYTLGPGKLFGLGEWYGTIIYPNLSAEQLRTQYVDVYRVVMKKENDAWTLVTNPPELILGAPKYPAIPKDVLENVNAQKIP